MIGESRMATKKGVKKQKTVKALTTEITSLKRKLKRKENQIKQQRDSLVDIIDHKVNPPLEMPKEGQLSENPIDMKMSDVEASRQGIYGSIHLSHQSYGHIWKGLLETHFEMELPPLPGHVVAAMLAAMKVARSVVPRDYNDDNEVDAMNYTSFIYRLDPRNPNADER